MKALHGIVTAVPTLFDDTQLLRLDWMEGLIKFLLKNGVHGLYPCGTTGEMLFLSTDERKSIADTVVKTRNDVKPEVNVFIHTGSEKISDTIKLTNHAQEIGADGAGIVTPWYYRLDDEAIYQYYDVVLSNIPKDFPVYLYNIPQLSGNDLIPLTIAKLKKSYKNIVGIKYSFSDFNRLKEYIALDGIEVLVGADVQMVESMIIGAVGTVSGLSSVYPEIFTEIYNLYKEGQMIDAVKLEQHAYELGCIMMHGGNLSMFKAGLEFRGLKGGTVRSPLRNMDGSEKTIFIEALTKWERKLSKSFPLLKN